MSKSPSITIAARCGPSTSRCAATALAVCGSRMSNQRQTFAASGATGYEVSMDKRSATPEDLPPLTLSALRELDLEAPPVDGAPAHISSASGVARRGDFVYVVGDDMLHLGVFRMSKEAPGTLARALEGEIPEDDDLRAKTKADLE